MAAKQTETSHKCCNFKIQAVAYFLAIYHMVLSIILFVDYSIEWTKRKSYPEISNYNRLDIISSYLLLMIILLISISLLCGVLVNRRNLIMPFLASQTLDFILSFLMFCVFYSSMHSNQAPIFEDNIAISVPNTKTSEGFKTFEMCVRLITFCSCFFAVPTYLDFKSVNYMNYFLENHFLYRNYSTRLIIFTLFHAAVSLYKVLMIWCVLKVLKLMPPLAKKKDIPQLQNFTKVALPSYEEAIKTTSKDSPPPYSTV